MGLDELLDAGQHVAGVVEHGLLGVQPEVGQADEAGVAGVVTQRLGQGDGRSGDPRPAGAGEHRHRAAPCRRRGHGGGQVVGAGLGAGDRPGIRVQDADQVVAAEARMQDSGRAEGHPVTGDAAVVDHERGAPRGPGRP